MSGGARAAVDRLVADADASGPAALPRRNGELVFEAPWESRAFGVAVALTGDQSFEWEEFRQRLIGEIGVWERDPARSEWSYYERWLAALERLLLEQGVLSAGELEARMSLIEQAALHEHEHEHDHDHDH